MSNVVLLPRVNRNLPHLAYLGYLTNILEQIGNEIKVHREQHRQLRGHLLVNAELHGFLLQIAEQGQNPPAPPYTCIDSHDHDEKGIYKHDNHDRKWIFGHGTTQQLDASLQPYQNGNGDVRRYSPMVERGGAGGEMPRLMVATFQNVPVTLVPNMMRLYRLRRL